MQTRGYFIDLMKHMTNDNTLKHQLQPFLFGRHRRLAKATVARLVSGSFMGSFFWLETEILHAPPGVLLFLEYLRLAAISNKESQMRMGYILHFFLRMNIQLYLCIIPLSLYMYIYINIYVHIYIYIYLYLYIYIYTYTSYFGVNMAHLLWFSL